MLEKLKIQNFRGFRDLDVDRLGRINIFAGRNNTGKSTLLEAIFLLGGAGDPEMALNSHIVRMKPRVTPPKPVWATLWTPLFSGLDTDAAITLSGRTSSEGDMHLTMKLRRPVSTKASRSGDDGILRKEHSGDQALEFTYVDSRATRIESEARDTAEGVVFVGRETHVAFEGSIIQPGRDDLKTDAVQLGKLRKRKLGHLLLEPLQRVYCKVKAIEDNASSGTPMILVDIGLPELVPLSVMGGGMTHLVRILLAAASAQDGVVLIDEVENGLHHSILADVWRVIGEAARKFNVQVFATTHSFECVSAAHEALGPDGFRLHRFEVVDGTSRCVTLSSTAVNGVIRHNLEVR